MQTISQETNGAVNGGWAARHPRCLEWSVRTGLTCDGTCDDCSDSAETGRLYPYGLGNHSRRMQVWCASKSGNERTRRGRYRAAIVSAGVVGTP